MSDEAVLYDVATGMPLVGQWPLELALEHAQLLDHPDRIWDVAERSAMRAIELLTVQRDQAMARADAAYFAGVEAARVVARQRDDARMSIIETQNMFKRFIEDVATEIGFHAPHVATRQDVLDETARVRCVGVEYQQRRNALFELARGWEEEGRKLIVLRDQSSDEHRRDRLETVAAVYRDGASAIRAALDAAPQA